MKAALSEKILRLLASVAETEEVRMDLDLPLYEDQILDSMKTVELIVMLEEQLGVKVSPAEFERESWKTPRNLIADIERRLHL